MPRGRRRRGGVGARLLVGVTLAALLMMAVPALAQEGVGRFGGADRFDTALLGSQSEWADNSTNTVVLASAFSYPDALSASAFCGELRAPLLLTSWGSVPANVMDEIARVTPFDAAVGRVVLIGGTAVIGQPVVDQLEAAGFEVSRIAGDNRYETSLAIAEQLLEAQDDRWSGEVWLARGDLFPDGISVSPYAYQIARPVLLTPGDAIPSGIATFMEENVSWAGIVGGPAAISANVVAQRDAMGIDGPRIAGDDRYETAVELAEYALGAGGIPASSDYIGIASGEDFPDALTGGIVTGQAGGVMLLSWQAFAPQATLDFAALHTDPDDAWVFGGHLAVSENARAQIEAVLYP